MSTLDSGNRRLVRRNVADHVKGLIRRQHLRCGDRLPSYDELCGSTGASLVTVKRGMDLLVEEGIVRCIHGRGSFVSRELVRVEGRLLKTVGIVHTASTAYLFSQRYLQELMQGIGDAPVHRDIQIYCMRGDGFVTAAQLADRHVDGVILLGLESDAFVEEFATWGVPGVLVDQVSAKGELDCVACDNETAAQRAVRHLVELGHRHIRYVGVDPRTVVQVGLSRTLLLRSSDCVERREAAVRAMSAIPDVRWDDFVLNTWKDRYWIRGVLGAWQQEADRPTAFLVESDILAAALARELSDLGIAVPGDLSIVAVACAGEAKAGDKELTGNRVDFTGMGRKAVELLRRRCEEPGKAPAPRVYRVGSEWVEGRTCGRRET